MDKARDNTSMATGESQEQEGGFLGAKKREESPFCHIDRHVGRDVLRADIVKDDSRVAVFSEQGSICVTMTVIARLPDCDGQAADAVSAYTPVKLEDAPRLLKFPKLDCPYIWIRLPRHKMAQIMVQYGRPSRSC